MRLSYLTPWSSPVSLRRTSDTERSEFPVRGKFWRPGRRDREPIGFCEHDRFDEPCRISNMKFFPLSDELDDSGMRIAKDAVNGTLWITTREVIQIG